MGLLGKAHITNTNPLQTAPMVAGKPPVTIEVIGLVKSNDGISVVTALIDESQIIHQTTPDVLAVSWPELKKAAVRLRLKI